MSAKVVRSALLGCCFFLAGYAPAEVPALKVIGPCSPEPVFTRQFQPDGAGMTAGGITELVFKEAGLSYEGGADGVTAIMGWSSGAQAVEPLPGGGLRVYGWCYAVDGSTPAVAASEFMLAADTVNITWFYAYSELGPGGWRESCIPAWTVKPAQFCPRKDRGLSTLQKS